MYTVAAIGPPEGHLEGVCVRGRVKLCLLWQQSDHLRVTWKVCVCVRESKVVFIVAGFGPPDGPLEGVCV